MILRIPGLGWASGILALCLSVLPASASYRIWTSTAGTRVEAMEVAQVNGEVWLRPRAGGALLKVAREKLSAEDRALVDQSAGGKAAPWLVGTRTLRLEGADAATVRTIELLATVEIPRFDAKSIPFAEALSQLENAITENDLEGRRVVLRVDPHAEVNRVGVALREVSALRVLELMCSSAAPGLVGVVSAEGVMLSGREGGVGTGGVFRSAAGKPAKCTVEPATANLVQVPGFETISKRWVFENQPQAFRRIPAAEVVLADAVSDLGKTVMRMRASNPVTDGSDGPPYITQEIAVPSGTKSLIVCCDLARTAGATESGGVRLSITDPAVSYLQGSGNKFPYTRVRPERPGQWQHMEWVVDVSELKSRKLTVGFMFPLDGGDWFIDNTRVSVAPKDAARQ